MTPSEPTPVLKSEIESIFGDGSHAAAETSPAPTMRGEWARLWAFIRAPRLDLPRIETGAVLVLVRVYLLDMLAMFVLMAGAGAAVAMGAELPKTAIADMEITFWLALGVIVAAPVFEELGFRSWLSGRPAHIAAILFILAGAGFSIVLSTGESPALGALAMLFGVVAAGLSLFFLWKRAPFAWFTRFFPLFFWLAASSFALIHVFNFEEKSLLLLALVLPQFLLGILLGYVRVRIGLWSAIALHAMHNATALGISVLAMGAG